MSRLLALLALLLLAPFLLLIALLIKITMPGPILHRAVRLGRHAQPFTLYKYRTMVVDAHRLGPPITAQGDPRITPLGRLLRRTKLDELPQLINILQGTMAWVGPRPEDPAYLPCYTTPAHQAVLHATPGLTSPASLHYRREETLLTGPDWQAHYREHILPHKLQIEAQYLQHRTLWTDLRLILATLLSVFH